MGKKQMPERSAACEESQMPKKKRGMQIPNVAAMGGLHMAGRASPSAVCDDKIHVGLYAYAAEARTYSACFGKGKLWVAQLTTTRQPSPIYKSKRLVELYGAAESRREDPPPRSLDAVAKRYHAEHQIVWNKTDDIDDIGWVKGRTGWYIEEAYIKEFFMYFDDLMAWRKDYQDEHFEKVEGDIQIVIHMMASAGMSLVFDKVEDELQCDFLSACP
jgi:hypothetical protein